MALVRPIWLHQLDEYPGANGADIAGPATINAKSEAPAAIVVFILACPLTTCFL